MEKKSIYDNLFKPQAIIDDNKHHMKDTYTLLADSLKCSDRQWLHDACNELSNIWLTEEVELIRKTTSKAIVTIDTPVGYTNEITLHNIIKLGTIIGPILCIVETDRVNKIGERWYARYGPEIKINNLLYVDDIIGVGSPIVIANKL